MGAVVQYGIHVYSCSMHSTEYYGRYYLVVLVSGWAVVVRLRLWCSLDLDLSCNAQVAMR